MEWLPITLYCHSSCAFSNIKESRINKTEKARRKYNFIRDINSNRSCRILMIKSKNNLADLFTKGLPRSLLISMWMKRMSKFTSMVIIRCLRYCWDILLTIRLSYTIFLILYHEFTFYVNYNNEVFTWIDHCAYMYVHYIYSRRFSGVELLKLSVHICSKLNVHNQRWNWRNNLCIITQD